MAEFAEVMKQFHRMCVGGNCSIATECPMYPACNISQCRRIAFEKPAEFENRVMDWAKAHPEPKYPTWFDWMKSEDILIVDTVPCQSNPTSTSTQQSYVALLRGTAKMFKPIPADIAEKLEIPPKEEKQ